MPRPVPQRAAVKPSAESLVSNKSEDLGFGGAFEESHEGLKGSVTRPG
jgi:hypothetical protein